MQIFTQKNLYLGPPEFKKNENFDVHATVLDACAYNIILDLDF